MTNKKEEFMRIAKEKCIDYFMKKGFTKQKAEKIAMEYMETGLDFPEELIVYNKVLK